MCMQNVSICQCLLLIVICFFVTKLEIWIDSSSCLVTWHRHTWDGSQHYHLAITVQELTSAHLGRLSALSLGYHSTRVDISTPGTALSTITWLSQYKSWHQHTWDAWLSAWTWLSQYKSWHWHTWDGSQLEHGYHMSRHQHMPHYPFSKQMWWSFHERNQSSSSPGHEG